MIQQSFSWAYIWRKPCFEKMHAPLFIAALFTITKMWKQPECPLTENGAYIEKCAIDIKKMYICAMEYYSVMKMNEIMPFAATLMDLEIIVPSEVSQISSVFYLIQFVSRITKHFSLTKVLKVKVKVLVTQSCPALCHPMDCSPPGSSVHGILQARILE